MDKSSGKWQKILLNTLPEKWKTFSGLKLPQGSLKSGRTVQPCISMWVIGSETLVPQNFGCKLNNGSQISLPWQAWGKVYKWKRVTPYMHIMVGHIPWFFRMYKTVKILTGQSTERNNDVARSIPLRKSNKWDSVGDVSCQESSQWPLKNMKRTPRIYCKLMANY